MSRPDPLTQATEEAVGTVRSWKVRARDWLAKWVGGQLATIVGGGVGVGGLLWVAFPWAVALGAFLVVLAAVIYAVYARKQLVEERTMRRRAFVGAKRIQQRALQSELTLRQVALALAGDLSHRRRTYDARTPGAREVRQAADYVVARARAQVEAATDRSPTDTSRRQRRAPAAPTAPNVDPWVRRAGAIDAEIEELEAEIQALSVPDSPALEEALIVAKQKKRTAHDADRAARERHRAGQTPSPAESGMNVGLSVRADGTMDARQVSGPSTPEQIAESDGD